jgi:hypothetical protein
MDPVGICSLIAATLDYILGSSGSHGPDVWIPCDWGFTLLLLENEMQH